MNEANRERLLYVIAATAIGLIFVDKIIFAPLTKTWKARSERVTRLTKDVNRGKLLIERDQDIRARWKEMEENALPKNRSESEILVLNKVDAWSRSARFTLNSIVPAWQDREKDHARMDCRIEGTGDMNAVMQYLYDLGSEKLAMRVESLEIVSRDKNGRQLSMDLRFSALELPEERR